MSKRPNRTRLKTLAPMARPLDQEELTGVFGGAMMQDRLPPPLPPAPTMSMTAPRHRDDIFRLDDH